MCFERSHYRVEDLAQSSNVEILPEAYPHNIMLDNQYLPQYASTVHNEPFFSDGQLEQPFSTPKVTHGCPSPFLTTPTSMPSSRNVEASETLRSYVSESSSASSIDSPKGYLTPCSSISSRRQSLLSAEGQEYFLAATQSSPTPAPRRRSHQTDSRFLAKTFEGFSIDPTAESLSHGVLRNAGTDLESYSTFGMYQDKSKVDWQEFHNANIAGSFDAGLHIDIHGCLEMDLTSDFDPSLANGIMDMRKHFVHDNMSAGAGRLRVQPSTINLNSIAPSLLAPFDDLNRLSELPSRSPSPETLILTKSRRKLSPKVAKLKKPPKEPKRTWADRQIIPHGKDHRHPCPECNVGFRRPEHLKRHVRKHLPLDEVDMLPCKFAPDCKMTIKDRPDNMRAHVQTTHFKYGKTERGGKNRRYSMRASLDKELKPDDERWTLLLDGEMLFGDETGYWKMIGFSIKETSETRIKDLIEDWEGPRDQLLKDVDPRWKALLDGTMTFEQSMQVGAWMAEEESEGVLGVDMATSKAMGLERFDPRWRKLKDGTMSVEVARKLGVEHLILTRTKQEPQ